ncbi:hypothetical protein M427DRAFT_403308 [Gonapodya prolifera JEL478]|uniref:Uncharacterized protein n=1 Tax=Gonapodya prolifera (strain JEL478) TaxID=1344416 RepID=A0A139ATT5_GONPJ|nr:hypothetical protein M427DRAFT_403308 [Gonapodya prolifera JEL478]|eukprot:KXS20150.1 hypothetical protein M427DRAFT_403308 [Gonapodya prolifera JEL478]
MPQNKKASLQNLLSRGTSFSELLEHGFRTTASIGRFSISELLSNGILIPFTDGLRIYVAKPAASGKAAIVETSSPVETGYQESTRDNDSNVGPDLIDSERSVSRYPSYLIIAGYGILGLSLIHHL